MAFSIFKTVCAISGIASVSTLFVFFFKSRSRGKFPYVLWYVWCFCLFPFILFNGIFTTVVCAAYLINDDLSSPIFLISYIVLGFSGQQIRITLIITILERLVATIFIESYAKLSQSKLYTLVLCLLSYFLAIMYTYVVFARLAVYGTATQDLVTGLVVVLIHVFCTLACKLLQIKNLAMYKLLAFRVSLRKRYQILQNVKALSLVWMPIVILSTIAPLGQLSRLIYFLAAGQIASPETHYFAYNLAIIIIQCYKIRAVNKAKKAEGDETEVITTIVGAMGQRLPTTLTFDGYFRTLKNQWN